METRILCLRPDLYSKIYRNSVSHTAIILHLINNLISALTDRATGRATGRAEAFLAGQTPCHALLWRRQCTHTQTHTYFCTWRCFHYRQDISRCFSPFSQPALPHPPPVSPFLDPWSPLTSRSPKEPYPSLHRVSGMTCHLNSAPFLYLHHHHSKS